MSSVKPEIRQVVDSYVEWLREGISASEIAADVAELTTPFMDRHNDYLQVYLKRVGKQFEISDEGETVFDLTTSGVDVTQGKRKATIEETARGFGVHTDGQRLLVSASEGNLGQKIHALIQSMLAVNDLYVLARSRVAGYFREDVEEYLNQHAIRFSKRVKLPGKSGYDHSIDFLIPRSESSNERILQTVGTPSKNMVTQVLWTISDAVAARSDPVSSFVFINDKAAEVKPDILEALDAYDVRAFAWSERDSALELLAA